MSDTKPQRLDDRRQAFLVAARQLFIRKGYETTSLADVVDAAGGSLATLYKLFGNKIGLLRAIVVEEGAMGAQLVREAAKGENSPVAVLRNLGKVGAEYYTNRESVLFLRLMISVSIVHPECGREFFDNSIASAQQEIEKLFQKWADEGFILPYKPKALANIFFALIAFDVQLQAICAGGAEPLSEEDFSQRVELFLQGTGLV
ncbi:TetR family transcriptional regulator [Altererythrobacter indicus]|uniref:TetR family transcriptional regulator n=1 Tax=Altericroceibacterium indicum TaxID=374177 RepID=A0A845A6V3_9SPHN|nr:TetR/AcrR family transcriptional regulator [Altericroceibacterium indicum]MXP24993.1 TetR family transcriptional regulator [Altericroceibacterium indicum]